MAVAESGRADDFTFGGTWPFEPRWLETDGVHLHYVDEGPRDGHPVVFVHGTPTWSYLWRKLIPPLVQAGYRCVAHDELGFGRSEKPARQRTSVRGTIIFQSLAVSTASPSAGW